MKILHIGDNDLIGNRFNGYDLSDYLNRNGHVSEMCVWRKFSDSNYVHEITTYKYKRSLRQIFELMEKKLSIQTLLYPFYYKLPLSNAFREYDIVHYHLIHNRFFSLPLLPILTRMKPSVWTLHDPWAMTGHCVYPLDCMKWKTGCGDCPRLDTMFKIERDHTSLMWKTKKYIYNASKIDLVVASKWMLDMVQQSPLLSKFRVHHIPFGVDLNIFRPMDQEEAKKRLGIFPGSIVVCFRSTINTFKGTSYIKECLHKLSSDKPICLLSFAERGLLDEFRGRYQIVELGWVLDTDITITAYHATDIFLMPSTAEAFGMMAIEAMACGKPVIVFDNTSLPEVVQAPNGGISVRQGDGEALLAALNRLLADDNERLSLGREARLIAEKHYNFIDHADAILNLYNEVLMRSKMNRRAP